MAEQTEWFKQQSVTLEKEIDQEDELRKSQSSHDAGSSLSSSGLARVNGYEYLPANTKPGFTISRTELRIRQTGAHGLATKPLRSTSDYVPVAMSKKSAVSYRGGRYSSPGRKRSHNHVAPSDEVETAHKAALHALKRPRTASNHSQVAIPQKPKSTAPKGGRSPYQLLQSVDSDDEEVEDLYGDDDATEELYDEEEEQPGQLEIHASYFEPNGDHADDEDEDEPDEEEAEEEDENDESDLIGEGYEDEEEWDEDDTGYQYPVGYLQGGQEEYEDAATTPASNPQLSRAASSAPGASVDDAFVIDDSD
jgi:hypothetical protein